MSFPMKPPDRESMKAEEWRFVEAMAAAVGRDAALTAESYLPPSTGAVNRRKWCERYAELVLEGNLDGAEALRGASAAGLALPGFHGRYNDFLAPFIDEALAA